MMLCAFSLPVDAAEMRTTVTYLEDGSYIVTEIRESTTRAMTKVGDKTDMYYSATHELQWKMTVTGEFLYDGTTATCTYATGTVTIYNTDDWYFISDSSYCSQNTATYSVTFGRTALGVTTSRPTYSVSVSCDKNGNMS